ncbi:M14 family metallopeptidase [Andreprevotia chitinilytica]|uniref:M14 family metallopeptidase n=1 Tax=Andreprevotia chitinilytica TaxID=396808 RepID=UPI0005570C27|nr:M14-type cytosolic carboxypeptidase [Andreprevotia chitinilytica]
MPKISSHFDAGAIEVVDAADSANIRLKLRPDNASEFAQWFHFRLIGGKDRDCVLRIENASQSAYPVGWDGYNAVASYDRETWFRVPGEYDGKAFTIRHTPARDSVYYAYFEPYPWDRHLRLIGGAVEASPWCELVHLGSTLDGRDLDALKIGVETPGKRVIWIIARQHPGETMAEWFAEGLLEALTDEQNALGRALLEKAVFYVVPNMNPDGSVRGNLRTNAAGANLNREWQTPTLERSPEVFLVRQKMLETGVDAFLDVHGDESIPHNFVAGCEGNPSFSPRQDALQAAFKAAWLAASPDFQTEHGYGKGQFGPDTLKLATNWVGDRFGCLAYTIEMPFKDTANRPLPEVGWNGERSRQFGASVLAALYAVADQLK